MTSNAPRIDRGTARVDARTWQQTTNHQSLHAIRAIWQHTRKKEAIRMIELDTENRLSDQLGKPTDIQLFG
jgi:hypothetical protein